MPALRVSRFHLHNTKACVLLYAQTRKQQAHKSSYASLYFACTATLWSSVPFETEGNLKIRSPTRRHANRKFSPRKDLELRHNKTTSPKLPKSCQKAYPHRRSSSVITALLNCQKKITSRDKLNLNNILISSLTRYRIGGLWPPKPPASLRRPNAPQPLPPWASPPDPPYAQARICANGEGTQSPKGKEHNVQSHMFRPTSADMRNKYCGDCYDIDFIQRQYKRNHKSDDAAEGRATCFLVATEGRLLYVLALKKVNIVMVGLNICDGTWCCSSP